MKKILFVLDEYYPDYSTNGICVKKIIDSLKEKYEIHIVCELTSNARSEEECFENIHIHRITTRELTKRRRIDLRRRQINGKSALIIWRIEANLMKLAACMKLVVQRHTVKWPLVRAFYSKLVELDCDTIFGVCFPIEALLAIQRYKTGNRHNCYFGAILFDKFSTNESLHRSAAIMKAKKGFHLDLEKDIFKICDCLIATFDWKKYLEQYHGNVLDKVQYIEIPALVKFNELTTKNNEFVYSGMVHKKMRPVNRVFEIIQNLEVGTHFSFCVKGNLSDEVKTSCAKDNKCIYYGAVSLERSYELIQNARGLISIGNTDVSQTPSKIFEYVSTGKPIIHFYFDKEDRCIEILKNYNNAFCFDLAGSNEEEINKLTEFICKSTSNTSYEELYQEFKNADPKHTAIIIENEIKKYTVVE